MPHEIIVEGFPPSVTDEELKRLFSTYGQVLSVRTERTEEGFPLRIARVRMGSMQDAEEAVTSMHHATLDGCTLLVFRSFKDGSEPSQSLGEESY